MRSLAWYILLELVYGLLRTVMVMMVSMVMMVVMSCLSLSPLTVVIHIASRVRSNWFALVII